MISERARARLANRKQKLLEIENKDFWKRQEQIEREEYFKNKICPDCGGDFMEVINWGSMWRTTFTNQSSFPNSYQKKFRCNNCNLTFWEN